MSKLDIIRAWKDSHYRDSLSATDLSLIPDNPAGSVSLTDCELQLVAGAETAGNNTSGCCQSAPCCGTCGSNSSGCCSRKQLLG